MSAIRRTSLSNKRTRGPINKRACQRCRLGKIKCDGDAASNRSCSNCEPSACIYDTTPRKNKQIEQLKEKLDSVQQQIIDLGNNFQKKLAIKDREMDLLCLLYESRNYFIGCEEHLIIFNALREVIKQGACVGEFLDFTGALLSSFSSNENQAAGIIGSLERIVNCVGSFQRDVSQLPDLLLQINNLKNRQDGDCHNNAELHNHHHHHSSHQCNNILDHNHHQHYSDNGMSYNNDLPIPIVSSSIDQSPNMYNITNTVADNSHSFIDPTSFNQQQQHNNNDNTANVNNSNYELVDPFFPYEIINNNGNLYAIPQQPAQSPPSPTTTPSPI